MPASNIKSYIRNPRKFNRDKTCTWEEPGPEAIHAGDWTAGAQPCWKHNNSQRVQQVAQRGLDPALGRSISYRPREVLSYLNYCVTKSDSLLHSKSLSTCKLHLSTWSNYQHKTSMLPRSRLSKYLVSDLPSGSAELSWELMAFCLHQNKRSGNSDLTEVKQRASTLWSSKSKLATVRKLPGSLISQLHICICLLVFLNIILLHLPNNKYYSVFSQTIIYPFIICKRCYYLLANRVHFILCELSISLNFLQCHILTIILRKGKSLKSNQIS